MKDKYISILLILFFAFISNVSANTISVTATTQKKTIPLDENFILQVTVKGIPNCPFPTLPVMENFILLAKNKEATVIRNNGTYDIITTFNFLLTPLRHGNFTIKKAIIHQGDTTYSSNAVLVTVLNKTNTQAPTHQTLTPTIDSSSINSIFFMTLDIDKKTGYIYDQFTATLKFFHLKKYLKNIRFTAPVFSGCTSKDIGEENHYKQKRNGHNLNVTEKKIAFFPVSKGVHLIEPATLKANLFYKEKDKIKIKPISITSNSAQIEATPLPLANSTNPTSLVGDFTLKRTLSKKTCHINEDITVTVIINGFGKISTTPDIFKEADLLHFSIYDISTTKEEAYLNERLFTQVIIKKKLLPKYVGKLLFPELHISFFNPKTNTYQTKSSPPVSILAEE